MAKPSSKATTIPSKKKLQKTKKWLFTKDKGFFEKKNLFIQGRKDRLMISGGENIPICLMNPKDPPQLTEEKLKELNLSIFSIDEPLTASSILPLKSIKASAITYLYTSGSSAKPKIAVLSYKNHYYSALGILDKLSLTKESRYLLS